MTNTAAPTHSFELGDIEKLLRAQELLAAFQEHLLTVFRDWTRNAEVYDTRGKRVHPVEDTFPHASCGYSAWSVMRQNLPSYIRALAEGPGPDVDVDELVWPSLPIVELYESGDRGSQGMSVHQVRVPVHVLFPSPQDRVRKAAANIATDPTLSSEEVVSALAELIADFKAAAK